MSKSGNLAGLTLGEVRSVSNATVPPDSVSWVWSALSVRFSEEPAAGTGEIPPGTRFATPVGLGTIVMARLTGGSPRKKEQ